MSNSTSVISSSSGISSRFCLSNASGSGSPATNASSTASGNTCSNATITPTLPTTSSGANTPPSALTSTKPNPGSGASNPSVLATSPSSSFALASSPAALTSNAANTGSYTTYATTTTTSSSSSSSNASPSRVSSSTSPRTIAGSTVGGFLGLLFLLSGLLYCLRRRRKPKVAPSAEFMAYTASRHNPTPTTDLALIRDSSVERDSLPPTRTSTGSESYPSPALEKLLEAVAQMRVLQPKERNHELEEGRLDDDFMGM